MPSSSPPSVGAEAFCEVDSDRKLVALCKKCWSKSLSMKTEWKNISKSLQSANSNNTSENACDDWCDSVTLYDRHDISDILFQNI